MQGSPRGLQCRQANGKTEYPGPLLNRGAQARPRKVQPGDRQQGSTARHHLQLRGSLLRAATV